MARENHERVAMLLENNPYPQDVRVNAEARSLVAAGHSVTVFAPRAAGQPRREIVEGVEVVRFPVFDGSSRGAVGFLLEYLSAAVALHLAALWALLRGATVLHIHNPPDIFAAAGALFRLARRRVVFDHHDLFPETVEVKFGPGVAVRAAAVAQRLTFAVATDVIATNESYAEIARTQGRKPARAVTVVRNGPPGEWTRLPERQRDGVLERVELAYVGSISSQDGADGLAPVLAALVSGSEPIDAHLTVVGDGDARPALTSELARLGLSERVTFAGWVALDRVPGFIQAADICVDPAPATYVNRHSTMMKIAEYLAFAKPVVAYDLLETRRTAGGAAVLVPPGEVNTFAAAIRRIARDPGMRAALVARARQRAAELTWESSERALLGIYAAPRSGAGR